jgi:hypothetical protein
MEKKNVRPLFRQALSDVRKQFNSTNNVIIQVTKEWGEKIGTGIKYQLERGVSRHVQWLDWEAGKNGSVSWKDKKNSKIVKGKERSTNRLKIMDSWQVYPLNEKKAVNKSTARVIKIEIVTKKTLISQCQMGHQIHLEIELPKNIWDRERRKSIYFIN